MRLALVLIAVAFLQSGCAEAMFSRESARSHTAYGDIDFVRFRTMRASGPLDKGDVLATLGPPTEAIRQDTGDVFVYRRIALETNVLNLNPAVVSLVPTVPIPIYFRSTTTGRDDTLMLFFDQDGGLLGSSLRRGIDAPGTPGGENH